MFISDNQFLMSQWDTEKNLDLDPTKISVNSSKYAWWICLNGPDHQWYGRIAHRNNSNTCPFCSSQKISLTNCFGTLFPEKANYWYYEKNNGLTPFDVMPNTATIYWWKCPVYYDHIWQESVDKNIHRDAHCPFCINRKLSESNSLLTLYPELAIEWSTKNKVTPDKILANQSHKSYFWQCVNNPEHIWKASLHLRIKDKTGCPECNWVLFDSLWKKWENLCIEMAIQIYGNNVKKFYRLPNNKVPDIFIENKNIIIDAKLNNYSGGIKKAKKYYLPYCNRLEFWCLNKRKNLKPSKQIQLLTPQDIIKLIPNKLITHYYLSKIEELTKHE